MYPVLGSKKNFDFDCVLYPLPSLQGQLIHRPLYIMQCTYRIMMEDNIVMEDSRFGYSMRGASSLLVMCVPRTEEPSVCDA